MSESRRMDEDILLFLQQQLKWHQEHDLILAIIEGKLYAMRDLAEYRLMHDWTFCEVQLLNEQLQQLKREILALEQELYGMIH